MRKDRMKNWVKYIAAAGLTAAALVLSPQPAVRAASQGTEGPAEPETTAPETGSEAREAIGASAEWTDVSTGTATLSVKLDGAHAGSIGKITALQVNIRLSVPDFSKVDLEKSRFTFSGWSGVSVKNSRFDEGRGGLTVVIADDSRIMEPGEEKTLGTLKLVMTDGSAENVDAWISGGQIVADGELIDIRFVQESRVTLHKPEAKPSEPETKPSEPETKPSEPETKPSEPETKPSEPETKPSEPETKPSEPETKPSEPETKPSEPETKPSEPETKPSSPSYTVSGSHSSSSRPLGGYTSPQAMAVETVGRWLKSGDYWKFILPTGAGASNTWVYVKGLWYHMGSGGLMNTGWYLDNGTWYYLDLVDGDMKTGWRLVNNRWYYLEPGTGKMQTGWKELDGVWYYLNAVNGDMATGWLKDGDQWYYLKANGDMATGWLQIGGKWYYFHTQSATKENQKLKGSMYAGEKTPDGHTVNALGERQ